MKKLITLLLLSPLAFAEDTITKEIEFNLTCKVVDQVILSINDGKPTRYTYYNDSVKIGDNFPINFKMQTQGDWYQLSIHSDELLIARPIFESLSAKKYPDAYAFSRDDGIFIGNISSSRIYIDDIFAKADMTRYFKNDWQLLTTTTVSVDSTRMLTANCMNMPTKFDDMFSIIERISGKLGN